jgi:lambda repressor-like predicted transcriptional regulator
MTTTKKWDRPAIKKALLDKGLTLTGIALDAGLYASACRAGLIGASRPGAEAIAKALGVPFREMFPDSYTLGRHDACDITSNAKPDGRQKRAVHTDSARSVA